MCLQIYLFVPDILNKIFMRLLLTIIFFCLNFSLFSQDNTKMESIKIINNSTKSPEIKKIKNPGYKEGWKYGIDYSVILTPKMIEALRKLESNGNRNFKLLGIENFDQKIIKSYLFDSYSLPYALFGDFNQDGIIDAILLGFLGNEYGWDLNVIGIISKNKGKEYFATEFISFQKGIYSIEEANHYISEIFLIRHRKGEKIKTNNCGVKEITTDSFGVRNIKDTTEEFFPCDNKFLTTSCYISNYATDISTGNKNFEINH